MRILLGNLGHLGNLCCTCKKQINLTASKRKKTAGHHFKIAKDFEKSKWKVSYKIIKI